MKVERILEIRVSSLPTEIRKKIDTFLDETRMVYCSEYLSEADSWGTLNTKGLKEFHRKKKIQDDFDGSFNEMIEEYELELDLLLVEDRVALQGIDKIVLIK